MKSFLLFLLGATAGSALHAQCVHTSAVNVSGGNASQGNLVVDWSVGETALVETMVASSGAAVITHGLLQPNPMLSNTAKVFTQDEIRILPNPTFNVVEINILTAQQGTIDIHVFDAQGRNILTRRTATAGIGSIEKINLTHFSAGAYIIRLDLNPEPGSVRKTGSYKIIKY